MIGQIIFIVYLVSIIVNAIVLYKTHLWVNKTYERIKDDPAYEDHRGQKIRREAKELYLKLNHFEYLKAIFILSGPIVWVVALYFKYKKLI